MNDVSQFLPVKSTVFLVLMAVADEARHGYGIMQSVLQRSGGTVNLGTGHLYRHIRRLLDDGLIEEVEPEVVDRDDPRRRYYQLTDLGAEVVSAESERLKDLVAESRKLGFV
ncbi:MAG: PadR family transcriptional regulator [Gemmatimonadales bacterium]|jgi:DNA-binding PadR family transcriptional regulator